MRRCGRYVERLNLSFRGSNSVPTTTHCLKSVVGDGYTSGKTILVPGCPGTPTGVTERHRAARAAKAARVPGRLPGQS
jgi:hypothetical protein